ncbi:hypothetical protein Tco_0854913 [Tanacetum coccineum]
MWAADRIVALTPGSVITILETANEFAIKGNLLTLVKGNQSDGRIKTDPHKHIPKFFGICDMFKYRDTENQAVRLMMFPLSLTGEAKTWLDELNEGAIETWDEHALYKEMQSHSNHSIPEYDEDDKPMSPEAEAKLMLTFRRTRLYNDYRDRDSNSDNWRSSGRNDYNRDNYRSNSDDKPSLPSNTQPNPKGSSSKPYQPTQARNEHVNVVFIGSGKYYDPPINPNDQQNDYETPINFDSEDEKEESTPQPKSQTPKPIKRNSDT